MKIQWFNHLPKSEQESFKNNVISSKKVLDRLAEICYNTLEAGVVVKKTDYDSPSWAYSQADQNGYLRAFKEIYDLVNIESDKDRK